MAKNPLAFADRGDILGEGLCGVELDRSKFAVLSAAD
jgi:hypothetical protein